MVAVFVPALSSNVLSEHRLFNDATNRSNLELNYFHGCFSTQSCSKGLRLSVAEEQLCMYHVVVLESHVRERKTLKEG